MTSEGTGRPTRGSGRECAEDQTGLSCSGLWRGVFMDSPGCINVSDLEGKRTQQELCR